MTFQFKRTIYEAVPVWIKRSVCLIPFGWISGKAYRKTMARNVYFDKASREDILVYQEKQLGDMLRFATDQVPAYRPYRSAVEKFGPFDALKEFPLLSKDMLQENREAYMPRDLDQIPHYEISTGGTSGNQLNFYVDDVSQAVENAFQHRFWGRLGYTIGKKRVTFRGVKFPNLKPDVYWQHNPIYNEVQFSPFHMNEETMGLYVEEIAKFGAQYIYGFPSAIDMLAEFVMRRGLQSKLPRFRAALLISEGVSTGQRERIEKAFDTRVFSFYGHSERVIMGGECEFNTTYHHFPDYGMMEIIAEDGTICDQPGQRGELVGTSFLNRSMPLIRYCTGDIATRCAYTCECGRNWDRFDNVEGRWQQDMLIGRTGARMSIAALNMHGRMFQNVVRYQYFQENSGRCVLRVMPAPGYGDNDTRVLLEAYRLKVGDEVEFSVEQVDDIPLTQRGKLRLLDSRVKPVADEASNG